MAQQDIAGFLTGIGSAPIDPMQGASIRDREIALQQQALGGFRKGVGALTGGRVDARSTVEKAQDALAQLDPTKKEDRKKILQIVSRVSPERAPALRAAFAEKDKEEASTEGLTTATREAIVQKYGKERKDLLALAQQGMSLKDIDSFAETDAVEKYKVVGNNVLDVTTGKYLSPPPGTEKGGYTVSKIYDAERGANVVQFLDKNDPTIVLKEVLDTKDTGRQSATLLDLQSKNLEAANKASRESREANAVAMRLEKAAEQGMTGGVIATGEEFIKRILGSEDETTLLRKSADRLRVSRGVANLPVGPASDKDVALVMGGELEATANPATVAAYVRGIAKLAKAERDFYSTTNAWLDRYKDNGGLSSYMAKEQLETQLGHSSIVAAEKKLAEVNYDPAALAIFEQKFGFDYMAAKEELDRANETLATLKREDF